MKPETKLQKKLPISETEAASMGDLQVSENEIRRATIPDEEFADEDFIGIDDVNQYGEKIIVPPKKIDPQSLMAGVDIDQADKPLTPSATAKLTDKVKKDLPREDAKLLTAAKKDKNPEVQ